LFAAFCWLSAPVIFNPFPDHVFLSNFYSQMRRWINGEFNNKSSILAELDNEKKARGWLLTQQGFSWQAWWYSQYITQWDEVDAMKGGISDFLIMTVSKVFSLGIQTTPWILLILDTLDLQTVMVLLCGVIVVLFVFWMIGQCLGAGNHDLLGILRLPILLIILYVLIYYTYTESRFTLGQLLVGVLGVALAIYTLSMVVIEIISIFLILRFQFKNKRGKRITTDDKLPLLNIQQSEQKKDLLMNRMTLPPKYLMMPQKIWPLLVYIFLGFSGYILSFFSDSLMSFMFNSRVAASWRKDYYYNIPEDFQESSIAVGEADARAKKKVVKKEMDVDKESDLIIEEFPEV